MVALYATGSSNSTAASEALQRRVLAGCSRCRTAARGIQETTNGVQLSGGDKDADYGDKRSVVAAPLSAEQHSARTQGFGVVGGRPFRDHLR